jgi:hypothetical protein
VPNLGCEIGPAQCDAEQEAHSGHDPIAITDALTAFDEVELETAHLIGDCRIRRALGPSGESLTTADVAALRGRLSLRAAISSIIR